MKILVFTIATLIALAGSAIAQQAPQTVEQVSEQANGIIAALQAQRNQASDQAAAAQAAAAKAQSEVAKLTKELADLRAKEAPKPTPDASPATK